MASNKSIAIRVDAALTRIAEALGDGVRVRHKDPGIQQALQLEAIADAIPVAIDNAATAAVAHFSDLPADFPGRDALLDAGIVTLDTARSVKNLEAITGIGKATAAAITESLDAAVGA